jgi:hypothetical protein
VGFCTYKKIIIVRGGKIGIITGKMQVFYQKTHFLIKNGAKML